MIFVTGASGNVGREVVSQLKTRLINFRVGRRPNSLNANQADNSSVVFDYLDPDTFGAAVKGCKAVFLLRPPAISNTKATLNVFIDIARRELVEHFVFISVAGAASNPILPHHAVEQNLVAHKTGWTILRPGFFAQNLGDAYREDIRTDSRIYVPAGAARVAFVDARDVATVAVMALTDTARHNGKAYTLTGPQALAFDEVATMLSQVLGRSIAYEPANIASYMGHLRARGVPLTQMLVQTALHVGLRFGQAETVDPTLAQLLGGNLHSVSDYVLANKILWSQPTSSVLAQP